MSFRSSQLSVLLSFERWSVVGRTISSQRPARASDVGDACCQDFVLPVLAQLVAIAPFTQEAVLKFTHGRAADCG